MRAAVIALIIILVSTAALAKPALAESRYVIDRIVVGVRDGAGDQFPVIKYVSTGTRLEVIAEDGEFLYVQTPDQIEGWVKSKYVTGVKPSGARTAALEKRVSSLKENLKKEEAKSDELAAQVRKTRAEAKGYKDNLAKVRKQYNELVEMSGEVQAIAAERDILKEQIRMLREETGIFTQFSDVFLNRDALLWFLSGAGILFLGWLLGKTGRRERYY